MDLDSILRLDLRFSFTHLSISHPNRIFSRYISLCIILYILLLSIFPFRNLNSVTSPQVSVLVTWV